MKTKQQKQQNKSKWNAERNLVIAKKQAKKQQRKKEKKNSAEKETSGAGHLPVQKDDGGARWSNHHK
jgi:hypothetical protein